VARVGPCRDIVLLLLPLVLTDHEPCRTRAGEEGDDGRAHSHDEILDECFHVWVHTLLLPPINFPSSFLKEEREGLVSGLGVEVDNLMHSGLSYLEYLPDAFFHFSNWRNIFLQLGK
jgi:hypothetical protein